jgi:hypothetical protein
MRIKNELVIGEKENYRDSHEVFEAGHWKQASISWAQRGGKRGRLGGDEEAKKGSVLEEFWKDWDNKDQDSQKLCRGSTAFIDTTGLIQVKLWDSHRIL